MARTCLTAPLTVTVNSAGGAQFTDLKSARSFVFANYDLCGFPVTYNCTSSAVAPFIGLLASNKLMGQADSNGETFSFANGSVLLSDPASQNAITTLGDADIAITQQGPAFTLQGCQTVNGALLPAGVGVACGDWSKCRLAPSNGWFATFSFFNLAVLQTNWTAALYSDSLFVSGGGGAPNSSMITANGGMIQLNPGAAIACGGVNYNKGVLWAYNGTIGTNATWSGSAGGNSCLAEENGVIVGQVSIGNGQRVKLTGGQC